MASVGLDVVEFALGDEQGLNRELTPEELLRKRRLEFEEYRNRTKSQNPDVIEELPSLNIIKKNLESGLRGLYGTLLTKLSSWNPDAEDDFSLSFLPYRDVAGEKQSNESNNEDKDEDKNEDQNEEDNPQPEEVVGSEEQ